MLSEDCRDEELPWERGHSGPCMTPKHDFGVPASHVQADDRGTEANRAARGSARLRSNVLAVNPEHDP